MQRLNRHTRNITFARGICTATVVTPLVLVSMTFATGSPKESSNAVPQAPHTVQEEVNNSGALPLPSGKSKVKPQIAPFMHPGVAPFQFMYDVMTPWSMGYVNSLGNGRAASSPSPWGHWFWVTPRNPLGR